MASTREWFETVEEARRRAKRRLPRSVYMALVAGTEKGVTLQDNVAAFSELRFAPPRIANLPATRDLATSVLGQEIALPVIASPTGVQAVHPEGEAGVARGAAEAGTAMGLSSFGSMPVETVAQGNPKLFFQTYWSGTRDQITQRIERARQAGAKGLIVTLDWSFSDGRDWGTPASIRARPGVADAVGGQIEVLLDGGIRRGSDVVKALALGARAVMIGRAYLWGLAANGSAGVKNVFDVLRGGIDSTLLALGRSSIGELSPDDIIVPAEFSRGLHK